MTPDLIATLTLTAMTSIYALACWVFPFGRCRRCSGGGIGKTLIMRRLRACRACHGSGRRLRIGRRVYNTLHHIGTDAANAARAKDTAR